MKKLIVTVPVSGTDGLDAQEEDFFKRSLLILLPEHNLEFSRFDMTEFNEGRAMHPVPMVLVGYDASEQFVENLIGSIQRCIRDQLLVAQRIFKNV